MNLSPNKVKTLNIKLCIDVRMHLSPYRSHYSHLFCKSTAIICQHTWSALLKTYVNVLIMTFVQWFSYNHS